MPINKKKVQKNFSAAAAHYDRISSLQSEISRQLLSFFAVHEAARILDIGTGTGRLLWSLSKVFPPSELHGCDLAFGMIKQARHKASSKKLGQSADKVKSLLFVQADAEKLPYGSSGFDLALSNSAFQWVPNLGEAFCEVYRILKPGAEFCFSLFGEGTLAELYFSFQQAYRRLQIDASKMRTQSFISSKKLKEILEAYGFSQIILKELIIPKLYSDVRLLLSELKAMGASSATLDRSFGLGGRKILQEMIHCYENNFRNGKGFTATYHIILARAEKNSAG